VLALFVGILSGTYSSIFNASPLLVWWEERAQARKAAAARTRTA
jgi:preprotein translocase subunit SecF